MSIHFAPQWVKSIKPSGGGSATTPGAAEQSPTALNSSQTHHQRSQTTSTPNSTTQVPFPALSSSLNSPLALSSAAATPNQPMSYSRATHTPASPGFPNDGSYFPSSDRSNGSAPDPHPFRYTREQILGMYDEDKFKGMPIEFVDLLDRGLSVVATQPRRPLGMREVSETEKKILSTSVHPPMPRRVVQPAGGAAGAGASAGSGAVGAGQATGETIANGHTSRRSAANVTRDPTQPNGRGFGGFGRGEGGALAGAIGKPGVIGGGAVAPPGEGKAPGVLGGGFGGVGKRLVRGRNDAAEGSTPSDGARPWRVARGASGNFEGVLGFNGPQTANPAHAPVEENEDPHVELVQPHPQTAPITGGWRERLAAKQEAKKESPAAEPAPAEGLGSPWSGGQKQWRAPVGQDGASIPLDVPITSAPTSMSVIASPAATPVPDRDATIDLSTPGPQPRAAQPEPEPSQEILDAVKWYYLDPQQQEHGPFVATQMHDWYSESYFQDALPVRRESETGFYSLAELKMKTGNPVRPFVTAQRPPPPAIADHEMARQQSIPPQLQPFRDLSIGQQFSPDPRFNPNPRMPMQQFPQQQPFRNEPGFPSNQFPPQQQGFPQQFQSPGFVNAAPGPQWGAINPQQGMHSRLNGMDAFGSPGMPSPIGAMPAPFPPQNAFSPSIGQTLNRAPDFFSPSIGVGSIPTSPWAPSGHPHGGPQSHQLQPPFDGQQHIQHQQPMNSGPWQQTSPMQPMTQGQSADQPSYFPAVDQEASAPAESQPDLSVTESESQVEELLSEDPAIASQQTEPAPQVEEEQVPEIEKSATGPPPSAWAPVPAVSRKSSIAAESTPIAVAEPAETQTSSKLAPAPASASLPSKPVAAPKHSASENAPATPNATATPDKVAPKAAPWANDKEVKTPSGPSLREIQQAESRVAEARKQALAEARANNAVPSPALSTNDDMPTSMSWGLPSQGSKAPQVATPSATASPSTPVWGSGEAAAPKKTMKQIQEEEEKRRVKLAQAKAQAQGTPAGSAATSTPVSKRGYADLAATSAPPGAGWQTVGASGKGVPGAASPAPVSRVASVAKPAAVSTPTKAAPAPVSRVVKPTVDDSTPSVEFIRWTKQSLNGLNVNIDEFIQMLLSFPVDPPASERAGQLEIISDSVYSNSSTLDGRRFAQEFCTRRKADAKRSSVPNANGSTPVKATSLADVLKTQPKPQSSDAGFKIVKAKGKKKN